MTADNDPRFLALLVHRGLLDADTIRAAVQSGDPRQYLLETGAVTEEQWRDWQQTDAGARPQLSRYELGDLLGEGGTARVAVRAQNSGVRSLFVGMAARRPNV